MRVRAPLQWAAAAGAAGAGAVVAGSCSPRKASISRSRIRRCFSALNGWSASGYDDEAVRLPGALQGRVHHFGLLERHLRVHSPCSISKGTSNSAACIWGELSLNLAGSTPICFLTDLRGHPIVAFVDQQPQVADAGDVDRTAE